MPKNNITLSEIVDLLHEHNNYLILCHKNPDGDTIGSSLALRDALRMIGKKARITCADSLGNNIRFLLSDDSDTAVLPFDENEYVIAVDVAAPSLLGSLEEIYRDNIQLKIDHHATGLDYAVFNYTDSTASACGEIIFALITALRVPREAVAGPLYAAISSDTGGFRYGNTTPKTMRIGAELIECGASPALINHALFENRTQAEIRAITAAYAGMRYRFDGMVAVTALTNEDKRRLALCEEDLGIINSLTREVSGVKVGITIKQSKNDTEDSLPMTFRVSVRSDKSFPADRFCALFGGGGHSCAAGCELKANHVEDAVFQITSHLAQEENSIIIV